MEEEPQLSSTQVVKNEEDGGEDDEEFYEKIEAPKFVDFTRPDRPRPDDRYWFCLRVGCDQKHEEEMDPEAISKNFFLRVMAARSPNVRFQKALNKKASGMNEQCPLSAPAKPSKSRVSRLAVISSISQKIVEAKVKVKPLSKLSSTPKPKAKQIAAKYLTTPRNKKCLPNQNSFRSVHNPKSTSIAVPKDRIVAKALVFHSPKKKAISIKTSQELRTPLTKICEGMKRLEIGMKRLEITSQRKRVLGYSSKSSKDIRRDPNKSLQVDPSRRQLSAHCKDKSKAKELLKPPNCKDQETKSVRRVRRKSKGNANKPYNSMPKKTSENGSSDMEIDMKSREGSVLGSSRRIAGGNVCEERLTTEKTSGSCDLIDSTQEEAIPCLEVAPSTKNSDSAFSDDASGGEMNSLSNSEDGGCLEENDCSEGTDQEEKTKTSVVGHEVEALDSDDKENALAADGNRDLNQNKNHSGRKILGKQETNEVTKKVARALDKNLKEGLTVAATGAQGMKYKKPKPTNPKPFRLRTDERGILKETKLEGRIQSLVPQKETTTVSMFTGGNLQKGHGRNDNQKQSRKIGLTTPEGQVRQKIATITPQRRSNSTQHKTKPISSRFMSQKSENSLRKTKSSSLQGQYIRPKGVASMKQLNVIKETSSTASITEDAREPSHSDTGLASKASISAASRSLSRGKRRPATIPKEPNFHSVHEPKSSARKVA